jgi:hypothetical protein
MACSLHRPGFLLVPGHVPNVTRFSRVVHLVGINPLSAATVSAVAVRAVAGRRQNPLRLSTALGENELLVDLFCDNLRRYLAGDGLRNVFDRERGY